MNKRLLALLIAAMLSLGASGCAGGQNTSSRLPENPVADARQNEDNSVEKNGGKSDKKLRYQDDYYEYINHSLLDNIELSATDAHWDWFAELGAYVGNDMERIIDEIASSDEAYEKGSSQQKIRDMYECVSNMENRDSTGLGPLKPYLESIRGAADIEEYVDALARLSARFGFSSIVGGYTIMQDKADSSKYAVYMMMADTLIGKEYVEGENTGEYVDMYLEYIRNMLLEYGMTASQADASVKSIERLLRDICASSLTTEQMYDPSLTYNVYTKQELAELYSNVDIDKMLKTLKIDGQDKYIVMDVGQAKKINSLLTEDNLEALKDYSTFVMLNDVAKYSTSKLAKLADDMKNALYGITQSWEDEKIWKDLTQDMLPWEFGEIYVKDHFSRQDKEEVEHMIDLIIEEYKEVIRSQDWMQDSTKQKAIRKLETMQVKIGYPEKWPDAKDMMQVVPISEGGSLLSNLLVSMEVAIQDSLDNLGKPVDRSEWDVTPQTINAMYDPLNNEIIFPAAILQPPFYSSENMDAQNLGGIGFVIAHEISHAFDSSGSLYDEYGNYNDWWSAQEREEYNRLAQSIVEYYNGYEMMGVKINGELTLMENIADLGAMTCIASVIGDDEYALDNAFGQMAYNWASEDTASYMMYLLSTDTHAPNKIRVNAVLSSCDAFYEVYDIKETDAMYVAPEDRVGIWVEK